MKIITFLGKYLDQPRLISKFSCALPPIITIGAGTIVLKDTYKEDISKRKKKFIQNGLTMFGAVASSLIAPKITAKLFKTAPMFVGIKELEKRNTFLVDNYIKNNKLDKKIETILHKAKTNVLGIREIKILSTNLNKDEGKKLMQNLIPEPEEINSREIFSEIGRLSVFGLIPVLGGIIGGISGDKFSGENYREKIPNKIKEGAYQYLANIFLCNIGAGCALGILEKSKIKSKSARALGMITGIVLTGVVGGSAIANFISKKVINKCFKQSNKCEKERKPEPLDICLHSDDIATVAVMSGLKWIEPALPILYSISGYRAGIGYRGKQH